MGRLEGKVAVVTGGASGIGEGTTRLFAAEGARVVIADVQEGRGANLAEELGPTTAFLRADVSREEDVAASVRLAVEKWGRLDCMYNNAGFGGASGTIDQTDLNAYDATMAVLLRAVVAGMKHAAAVMKQQRSGSIISTASIAGLQVGYAAHTYNAAKAAVIHLTRSVAVELGEYGIRVNAICPGFVATHIFTSPFGLAGDAAEAALSKVGEAFDDLPPLKRVGQPIDIARAALWLASDESSYVSGHALVVDGGITAGHTTQLMIERLGRAYGIDLSAGLTPPARG